MARPMAAAAARGHERAALGARVVDAAYERFCADVDAGVETGIDPYAAESPAEFFAVMSSAFSRFRI